MKKRKDGRYLVQRKIDGATVSFYGRTKEEVFRKIEEYKKKKSTPLTFREIAKAWQDKRWDSFSPGTQNCYRSSLERALDEFGSVNADDVTAGMVSKLLDKLILEKYSAKTVKTQKTVINTIYRHAIIQGSATKNPAASCIIPRGLPKSNREPPSEDDIRKVLDADDEWIFPKLLLYTGMRRGEALALCYEDFDFNKMLITVNKEIIYRSNTPILVQHTKTASG